jgi:hypothetical protein
MIGLEATIVTEPVKRFFDHAVGSNINQRSLMRWVMRWAIEIGLVVGVIGLAGCGLGALHRRWRPGSGNLKTEVRQVSNFSQVDFGR